MSITTTALYSSLTDDLRSRSNYASELYELLKHGMDSRDVQNLLNSWDLAPGISPVEAQCLRLLQSILKKYKSSEESTEEQDTAALNKFLAVNNQLSLWECLPNTSGDEELIGSVKEHIYHFWNPSGFPLVSNPLAILDRGRTGPGASIGSHGEDFYTKMFSSPLTYTSEGLLSLYEWWTSEQPNTSDAEVLRRREYGDGRTTSENRLSFVPKDDTTSRTIATEPSLNMFFQLGLGAILTDRLNSFFGIDLSSQQLWNQQSALIGSKWTNENPSYVTIDLSSASDSLGLKLLDYFLPPDFNQMLRRLRSPRGLMPDGRVVEYNMMSTMGNGYTFPLQTMLFSCIVVTAIKSLGLTPERPSSYQVPSGSPASWGVFGDDIICHHRVHRRVLRLLDLMGFKVNGNKTFVDGLFRESCGHDYFDGHDVRGVYIDSPLVSTEALNVAINSLVSWSYKTGIPLPVTGTLLCRELLLLGRIYPVPLAEGLDAGIRMPLATVSALGYTAKADRNQSKIYRRMLAAPKQLRIGDGFISVPRGSKGRIYNASGLLLAFLRGDVRSGRISIRQTDTRYRVKGCVTPYWDYVPPVSDLIRQAGDRLRTLRLEIVSELFLASLTRG